MNVVDTNVLLYATNRDSHHHAASRRWLESALAGSETVGFAWVVLLAFVRIATHPAIFAEPLSSDQALGVVQSWLSTAPAVVLEPTARHLEIVRGLITPLGTAGNLVNDAHLAALALEYGAELVTFDLDFTRFAGVRTVTPS